MAIQEIQRSNNTVNPFTVEGTIALLEQDAARERRARQRNRSITSALRRGRRGSETTKLAGLASVGVLAALLLTFHFKDLVGCKVDEFAWLSHADMSSLAQSNLHMCIQQGYTAPDFMVLPVDNTVILPYPVAQEEPKFLDPFYQALFGYQEKKTQQATAANNWDLRAIEDGKNQDEG